MTEILQDIITLESIDNEGKHYDHLTRAYFTGSKSGQSSYVIDINSTLYPVNMSSQYTLLLSKSDKSIKDYEYVTNGQVYKIHDEKQPTEFFISFGGLLMQGSVSTFLTSINVDDDVYLMLRKVK